MQRTNLTDVPGSRGRPTVYQWEAMADGAVWELTHPDDFTCTAKNFTTVARAWGKRNGYRMQCATKGDTVWLKFTEADA